jgi:hypothetical protein
MPREGSFALAFLGRVRKVQEPTFVVAAGRNSFAVKRILESVLVIFAFWLELIVPFRSFPRQQIKLEMMCINTKRNDENRCIII